MISQKDIAKKLNMTQQAVSAALRGDDNKGTVKVAPETRQLVINTARQMGYRSNRYASILKGGRSHMIAVFHGIMTNDWIKKLRSVNQSVISAGFIPWTIEVMQDDPNAIPRNLDYILSAKIEGVVVAGAWFKWKPQWFWDAKVPVVALHGRQQQGVPFFAPNKVDGYCQVFRHLYEQGCRRPLICLPASFKRFFEHVSLPSPEFIKFTYPQAREIIRGVGNEILMGLDKFVTESGHIPQWPFIVFEPDEFRETCEWNEFELGRHLTRTALLHKPDALVFTNDSIAVGGLFECQEAGLSVPRDLCITGFNGEDPARYGLVPITTNVQPAEEMATATVAKLIEMIESKTLEENFEQRFQCRFEARRSSQFQKD